MPLVNNESARPLGRWPMWGVVAFLAAWSMGMFLWFHAVRGNVVLGVAPRGLDPASLASFASSFGLMGWIEGRRRSRA